MYESSIDKFFNFCGKFLKFALLTFTGAFIIAGIIWILYTIYEWVYLRISYLLYKTNYNHNIDATDQLPVYSGGTTRCPNCHLLVPCGPRCSICNTKLSPDQKAISRDKKKSDDLDSADVSIIQYSERKKYQKIRCPYCNALSKVIEEKYCGSQTRECRNGHIFVYDYESEMLIQDELNAKYN